MNERLEIRLREYETLRQESLTAMSAASSTTNFGVVVINGLVGIASSFGTPFLSGIVLILVVPISTAFVLYIWLGEHKRMHRVGDFLVEVETAINREATAEVLTWETRLRRQQRHMTFPYSSTVLLLSILSVASVFVGTQRACLGSSRAALVITVAILIQVSVYLHIGRLMAAMHRRAVTIEPAEGRSR